MALGRRRVGRARSGESVSCPALPARQNCLGTGAARHPGVERGEERRGTPGHKTRHDEPRLPKFPPMLGNQTERARAHAYTHTHTRTYTDTHTHTHTHARMHSTENGMTNLAARPPTSCPRMQNLCNYSHVCTHLAAWLTLSSLCDWNVIILLLLFVFLSSALPHHPVLPYLSEL